MRINIVDGSTSSKEAMRMVYDLCKEAAAAHHLAESKSTFFYRNLNLLADWLTKEKKMPSTSFTLMDGDTLIAAIIDIEECPELTMRILKSTTK